MVSAGDRDKRSRIFIKEIFFQIKLSCQMWHGSFFIENHVELPITKALRASDAHSHEKRFLYPFLGL